MDSPTSPQFTKIDFSGLHLSSSPGSKEWDSLRARVMDALLGPGFFEAVFDEISPGEWDEVFGERLGEAFGVPAENKRSTSNGKGYVNYVSADVFEILMADDPTSVTAVEAYTRLLCPPGIPSFSKMVLDISERLAELELMVRKMIFEGLHINKYYESHVKSTSFRLRLVRYDPIGAREAPHMAAHADMNILSLVYQHQAEGLEILTREGQWLRAPPKSCMIFNGETLTALTNGRLKPTIHRVKMTDKETRYSVGFSSHFLEGFKIEAPEELVDEEHPKLYKAYEHELYMKYRLSKAGMQSKDPLKDFCGVGADDVAA